MANFKHLGQAGLEQLLALLKAEFGLKVDKVEGYGLSKNDFSDALKAKLDGIAEGANKYEHAQHTAQALGLYQVQVDAEGHVIAVKAVAKEDITGLGIPGQDTTYVVATQSADGLMSATDKTKLDGIEEGANKYIHATHGAYAEGIYKITVDGEGHVTAATAVAKADLDAIINVATQTEAGLMSAEDKVKVDGLKALASKDQVAEADLEAGLAKKINDASAANHGHDNKALLDTYDQTNDDLKDAVAKKHAHTFVEAELNKIADGDVAKWNQATTDVNTVKADYLKAADRTAVEALITAEAARADKAEKANAAAITSGDAATLKSAQDYADQKIAAQIASAYKASGTVAFEALPEPTVEVLGNVYNISNDFTTDADFVEGAGKTYKAGVNVAIVEIDGAYKYDVMAMSFNGFVQEADIQLITEADVQSAWTAVFGA